MKPTDFSIYLTQFLSDYLLRQKNVSPNTILSYRDTFKLLLRYFQERERIPPEKLTMSCITQVRITSFLNWLETERGCGVTTRNLRLTAIHSFFRYAQAESPESLFHFQKGKRQIVPTWHIDDGSSMILSGTLQYSGKAGDQGSKESIMLGSFISTLGSCSKRYVR